MKLQSLLLASLLLLFGCATTESGSSIEQVRQEVMAAERAFAATMARRDFAAFGEFIDEDAVFFTGDGPLRGKAAVLAVWQGYFDGESAPFTWEPDTVEVTASHDLAFSTGPVYGPDGAPVARFNSVWRRVGPGTWRVVFDRGSPLEP